MIIGVSGHQHLPHVARAYAEHEIRDLLTHQTEPITGMSSLAEGADQLFAELVLATGGILHAIIPARNYETTFHGEALANYRRLRTAAIITELNFDRPDEQAYHAAGRFIVEHCNLLVAVWDGQPARGLGGTADTVTHAREFGCEVLITWPQGIRRE